MTEMFTWSSLCTLGGALSAVEILTEIFKGVSVFKKMPTRLLSFIIAAVVMVSAYLFTSEYTLSGVLLAVFNSALVSLSANSVYDTIAK